MSVTIYGQLDGDAWLEDPSGLAQIPVRLIHALSHAASMSDGGYAAWSGRRFDRDDLIALRSALEANALQDLDACAFTSPAGDCDQPALLGRYCPQHAKD